MFGSSEGSSSSSAEVSKSGNMRSEKQSSFSDNDYGSSNSNSRSGGFYPGYDAISSSFHNKLQSSRLSESERVDEMTNILNRLIQKTERLLHAAETKISDCDDVERLLTPTSRLYKENEIRMLKYIIENEASEEALLHYWTTENELFDPNHWMAMSNQINLNDPQEVEFKSTMLEALCETFPDWSEPNFRLARIKYHSKHYELAEHYATRAIQIKPWNFEAIRLLVAIFLDSGNTHEAQRWYERQLPRCDEMNKRSQWVQNAVNEAKKQLKEAEVFTSKYHRQHQHFGQHPSSSAAAAAAAAAVSFANDFTVSPSYPISFSPSSPSPLAFGNVNPTSSSPLPPSFGSGKVNPTSEKKENLQNDEDAWQ
jgi:tetratricopeptide (TPR) repeat protein